MVTEPPVGHPEAIIRPDAAGQAFVVERLAPRPELAEFVDYYWLVRWFASAPHRQQVVPQPRIQLAAEDGRLLVHGVSREPFFRTLHGPGHVLGATFHPGGFRPLLRRSVGGISGTVRPASELFVHDDVPAARRILAGGDSAELVATLEEYLVGVGPEPDAVGRGVTELVARAERRVEITRAETLATDAGMSLRSLQRLFTQYVGVGPKWVIQRFRILDAAAAAHTGAVTDWAGLAGELGFSDQAHLIRAFTQVVGTPPASYQRSIGRGPARRG
ncbi:helix-turn-helix domain-containing protein [Pengzhenrongella sp.]|uniref:helix-turn-helix domain-containing protein n=1 Tax=Pengzhenrongella sp. TaxID=2888820 RepID=UPI002F947932